MLQIHKKERSLEYATSDCCGDEVIRCDTLITQGEKQMKGLGFICKWCKNSCKPMFLCSECEQEIDEPEDQEHGLHSRCAYLFVK